MTTIALDESELVTILAALRLFRVAITEQSDLASQTPEQIIALGSMIGNQIMTSETGEQIATLEPAQIDDLIDRFKSV
jgi:hypothetical protein